MMAQIQEIMGFGQDALTLFGLLFLRIGAFVSVLPALGDQMIPARVKLAIALVVVVSVFPAVTLPGIEPGAPLVFLFFSETLVGFMFGITLRFLSHALLVAGAIAAQSTSLSQLLGGPSIDPQPALSNIIYMAGLVLIILADLHIKIIWALVELYGFLPIGVFLLPLDVMTWGVDSVASIFGLGFVLAAPFVLVSLIYNVAMGIINKAMPQLMVALVGAPAITAGGMILLFISLPILLPIWLQRFDAVLAAPLQALP